MSMTAKQFQPYLDRDGACLHCGTTEGLVPQHRRGRGMGGSKNLDHPSNIIVLCGIFNGLIESDGHAATIARAHGWKLGPGIDPLVTPVYDRASQSWFFLDDAHHRTVVG